MAASGGRRVCGRRGIDERLAGGGELVLRSADAVGCRRMRTGDVPRHKNYMYMPPLTAST